MPRTGTGELLLTLRQSEDQLRDLRFWEDGVQRVAFDPAGGLIAAAFDKGCGRVWKAPGYLEGRRRDSPHR